MTLDEFSDTDEAAMLIKSAEDCFNRLFVAINDRCTLRLRDDWKKGALVLAYLHHSPESFKAISNELKNRARLASVIDQHSRRDYIVKALIDSDAPKDLVWEWITLHDKLAYLDWDSWYEDFDASRDLRRESMVQIEFLTKTLRGYIPEPPKEVMEPEPTETVHSVTELLAQYNPS